jgi:hypothetical protein
MPVLAAAAAVLLLTSTHVIQHHGAVQCHSMSEAMHHVVYLAAESTGLIEVAQQLACCAAVRWVLQVMQGLQDSPCHLLPRPRLAARSKKDTGTRAGSDT